MLFMARRTVDVRRPERGPVGVTRAAVEGVVRGVGEGDGAGRLRPTDREGERLGLPEGAVGWVIRVVTAGARGRDRCGVVTVPAVVERLDREGSVLLGAHMAVAALHVAVL